MSARTNVVIPEVDGAVYKWRYGDVSLEVDAAVGARITAFRIGAENILTGPEVNALNYGSTFWTSPQAAWGWPPIVEIDGGKYEVTGEGADLLFKSGVSATMGIAVTKNFQVDSDRETVTIEYGLENRSAETLTVAPWEISRIATGGLTFFPKGGGVQPPSTLTFHDAENAIWFKYDPLPITDHQKLFGHGGEGWVAHIDVPRRMLLIKTFPQVERDRQAPGQAEIELYADPQHTYVEVEQQGAYAPLAAGAHLTWTVVWRLRRVPLGLDIAVGNKDLMALVRALVAMPTG
jgi:hypothetical protein